MIIKYLHILWRLLFNSQFEYFQSTLFEYRHYKYSHNVNVIFETGETGHSCTIRVMKNASLWFIDNVHDAILRTAALTVGDSVYIHYLPDQFTGYPWLHYWSQKPKTSICLLVICDLHIYNISQTFIKVQARLSYWSLFLDK